MKKTVIFLMAILCSACAAPYKQSRIAVLQNPETKQTVECRVDPWGENYKRQIDSCIYAYQKAGYRLVADSVDREE